MNADLAEVEPGDSGAPRRCMSFAVAGAEFALDLGRVREIVQWAGATRLPNVPAYVRGVINLRGVIVPIYDLGARFGHGPARPTETHVVIITALESRLAGLLVDGVSDLIDVLPGAIQPIPEIDRQPGEQFLSGLVEAGGRMVALIDLERLLADS
jgi:purine-binding chemotaxis protein CheW